MDPGSAKSCRQTASFSGAGPILDGDSIAGVDTFVTSQLSDPRAVICGNWSDLMVGIWGSEADLIVDPYSHSGSGTIRVVLILGADVAVRNTAAFHALTNIGS
jgi:hypothetical protein